MLVLWNQNSLSPFDRFDDLFSAMDRFDGFLPIGLCGRHSIPIDIQEDDGHLYVQADLPGIDKKNLEVTLEGDLLTLRVVQDDEKKKEGDGYHVRERRRGECTRSIRLPCEVEPDAIKSEMKDGVLQIKFEKAESRRRRKIEIKT
jgi:HSP20 family protein